MAPTLLPATPFAAHLATRTLPPHTATSSFHRRQCSSLFHLHSSSDASAETAASTALQCPHFQSCSGCTLERNLDLPPLLHDATEFFNRLGISNITFESGSLWEWRCRAKLAVRGTSETPLIGLYQEDTHNIVDIPMCRAHHPNINAAVDLLKEGISKLKVEPYNEDSGTGELRYVQTIFGNRWRHLSGERDFWEHIGGVDICLDPSSFGQANTQAFQSLLRKLQKHVPYESSVVDLYAGSGIIGLSLAAARRCRSIKCVEINKESKLSFEKSVNRLPKAINGNISWHNADASIEPLHWLEGSDVVVVDPTRKGLHPSVIDALRKIALSQCTVMQAVDTSLDIKVKDEKRPWVLRARAASVNVEGKTTLDKTISWPNTLVYISCGWESFKEDCKNLLSSQMWYLEKAYAFNFFPGTQSIEVLAVFKHGPRTRQKVVFNQGKRRKRETRKKKTPCK